MLQASQRPTSGVDVQDVVMVLFIELVWVDPFMALKKTSEIIAIGFSVAESAPNTFAQTQVDLQLNPLDQEVFVVVAIDLDPTAPDVITNTNTQSLMSLSTTSRTSFGNLNTSSVLANAVYDVRADAANHVGFVRTSLDSPPATLDYIGIISTNDFFVQLVGTNNANAKDGFGRVWGYRAKADSATYAALVQSEILSS